MGNDQFKIAIISYHRPECFTIKSLIEAGFRTDDITIFLQDRDDVEKYRKNHPGVRLELNENKGVSQNRNNVLKSPAYSSGDFVLLLDDDIISFKKMSIYSSGGFIKSRSRKITDHEQIVSILKECFEETMNLGSVVFGVAANDNVFAASTRLSKDGNFSVNKLFQGGLTGHIIDKKTFYNEAYNSVEDYEFQLREYRKGKIIIRRNDFTATKKKNRNQKGGLYEFYMSGGYKDDIDRLCNEYPEYVRKKNDYSGVIQIAG